MRRLALLIFFFFFLFSQKAFAATLSIQNNPSTINESDEFSLDISLSCSGCSDSYLRGVFFDSGTSYFGYTQDNSGNFSNAPGSSCTSFFKVSQSDIPTGSWSGKIKFKPDPSSSFYKGSGEYSFKIGRYTSSCSSPSVWSQEVLVTIIGSIPTPTSGPTSIPTPTKIPTSYQSPTPFKTTPTLKPTLKSVKSASTQSANNKSTTPSGGNVFSLPTPTPQSIVAGSTFEKNKKITIIILSAGAILFIIAAAVLIKKYFNEIKQWINT